MLLKNTRIVLINTSHPGNIGSVARAMKTMGLTELYLVSPLNFPHPKAHEMASNAGDVVDQAVVVEDLAQAIGDCELVVGTSARARTIPWPLLTPREFAVKAKQQNVKMAILFGREQTGLTNEELHRCHYHIHIPCNPEYSSLNLAMAVQVIAYELYVAAQDGAITAAEAWDFQWATAEQMEGFYDHLSKVLIELEFLKPEAPRQLMTRLRRLFHRARLDVMELNIMRGILGAIEKQRNKPS